MSVAKGPRQFVIVDRPAALAGRTADRRETSFVGETAAISLPSGSATPGVYTFRRFQDCSRLTAGPWEKQQDYTAAQAAKSCRSPTERRRSNPEAPAGRGGRSHPCHSGIRSY